MPTPPDQLQALETEAAEARERVRRLVLGLPEAHWGLRPAPERWSIGEHLIHLNLTSRAFLPRLEEAARTAREKGLTGEGPYRRDFLGWLLGRLLEPPVRMRVKTTAPFVPSGLDPREDVLRDFGHYREELAAALRSAAGLALDRIEVASPFDARFRYNFYSSMRILMAHERRHLWLAEKVRQELAA